MQNGIPTDPPNDPPPGITDRQRIIIGVLGGLAATATKFLGQDFARVFTDTGVNLINATNAVYGYSFLSLVLAFLGGLCAWAVSENHRVKLLAIAVAAPAMVTTFTGGGENAARISSLESSAVYANYTDINWQWLISSARAGEIKDDGGYVDQRSTFQKLGDGFRFVLRVGEPRYWVVVGSFEDKDDAKAFAVKINKADAELVAFVGIPNNEGIYPVIVGKYVPYVEAKETLDRAKKLEFLKAKGPFLSPG